MTQIRVVRGQPTTEEIAALVVVLAAVSGGTSSEDGSGGAQPRSLWTDRARLMTSMWSAGPRGWRSSSSRR